MGRKVLFVMPSAHLLGGLQVWLNYLLPGLEKRGWIAVLGLLEGATFNKPEAYIEKHPWKRWCSIKCLTGTFEGRKRAIAKCVLEARPDILVVVNVPDAYYAVHELRRLGRIQVRVVMANHGLQEDIFNDAFICASAIDAVVSPNRLGVRLAQSYSGFAESRVFYAPCGLEIPETPPLHPLGDEVRICYVGRLDETQKRVSDLIGIAIALKKKAVPFHLTLVGEGHARKRLEEAFSQSNLSACVTFMGHVSTDDVVENVWLKNDVLILTSDWETGPIVIWEAFAYGLCVVSSRYLGSGLEGALVDQQNALLFDVGDVEQATHALEKLWLEPDLLKELRNNAYNLAKTRYTTKHSIEAWSHAFEQVLSFEPKAYLDRLREPSRSGRWRWLGEHRLESLREVLKRKHLAGDPGGEWPHAYFRKLDDKQDFHTLIRRLDRSVQES